MRNILSAVSVAVLMICSFSSCSNSTTKAATYQCPMKCEGEKTYDKAGECPVCKMPLEEVKK